MNERPILFKGEMVRAILEGRKTQTRRPMKPQPELTEGSGFSWKGWLYGSGANHAETVRNFAHKNCPYGKPGDRLWVRESFLQLMHGSVTAGDIKYRAALHSSEAGGKPNDGWWWKSRPSIHMPRHASRITLEVTAVRVERLQDIGEEDAKAEGAFFTDYGRNCFHHGAPQDVGACAEPEKHHPQRNGWSMVPTESNEQCLSSARMAFANLWQSINGPDSWDENPWVWVVKFRRVDQ